ncbi:hypothetical protein D9615_006182 [Tricholomella constricta]|uniref:Uncharacterized protein n=1 Tax=Tricholomella constricta TaxID=117010 RepID=A0A8H5HBK4_9AGAR|nr:hypothetical protein D9615_006182 [Tricholomella constricta]
MDQISNNFGFFTGALAILGSVASLFLFYRNFFPNAQMEGLEKAYQSTQEYYEAVRGEGILPDAYAEQIEADIKELEYTIISLRDTTYKCSTVVEEFVALMGGLSRVIGKATVKVRNLKAKIATVSEEQRRLRGQLNVVDAPTSASGTSSLTCEPVVDDDVPQSLLGMNIPRVPMWSIGGILSHRTEEDEETLSRPEPTSDAASSVETLVDTPSRWSTPRLWLLIRQWRHSTTDRQAEFFNRSPILPSSTNDLSHPSSRLHSQNIITFYLPVSFSHWPMSGYISKYAGGFGMEFERPTQNTSATSDSASITEIVAERGTSP